MLANVGWKKRAGQLGVRIGASRELRGNMRAPNRAHGRSLEHHETPVFGEATKQRLTVEGVSSMVRKGPRFESGRGS
jgi:hypothetical protein